MTKINQKKQRNPSKGELFIEDYLINCKIKYQKEVKIEDLKNDKLSYRQADFYLPKLGFYVEYFGMYNKTEKNRSEYDYKRNLYINNRKPTIFLYPEDLGILDFSFHTEIKKLFKYKIYHSKGKYFKYSFNRYVKKGKPYLLILVILFYVLGVLFEGLDLKYNDLLWEIIGYMFYGFACILLFIFIQNFLYYIKLKEILGFVNLKEFN